MKKILFMLINMNIGGTEKSLLNLLNELPKDKYDITVLLLEEYGGYLNDIPDNVTIKYLEQYSEIKDFVNSPPFLLGKNIIKNGNLKKGFNVIFFHVLSKIFKDRSIYFKYILQHNKVIEEYDVAIAFAGPMDFITYYVINKIKAKKRIQWVHFDVEKIGINVNFCRKMYSKFDNIFVVSQDAKYKLVKLIPQIDKKTQVLENIVSSKTIKKLALQGETFPDDFNGIRILTVGRISKEKGQHMTIPVMAKLKEEGYNVRWYCIGEGSNLEKCKNMVKKYKLEDEYIFLGVNKNPYTMMKNCDIYVQPSIHEGFCITLAEARCFDSPIVTTNFVNADRHVKHEETGLIADINEESIYWNIKRLLDDDKLRKKIQKKLLYSNPDNRSEIKKLEHIIDEV